MTKPARFHRVNIMLREDQYRTLTDRGLNVSGLIRDLLGDYLAENKITLQVSEETRRIYDMVVANTGSSDAELEEHLRVALRNALERRISEMQVLHKKLGRSPSQSYFFFSGTSSSNNSLRASWYTAAGPRTITVLLRGSTTKVTADLPSPL